MRDVLPELRRRADTRNERAEKGRGRADYEQHRERYRGTRATLRRATLRDASVSSPRRRKRRLTSGPVARPLAVGQPDSSRAWIRRSMIR